MGDLVEKWLYEMGSITSAGQPHNYSGAEPVDFLATHNRRIE